MIYRIRGYHGGLGDQLQFSTLPEELTKLGHEVYLLKDCDQVQPFRNEEIKQLVWLSNPYIKGEIEGEWNLGDIPGTKYINTEDDFIKNWERISGIEPKNSFPKIYYQPKYIEGIQAVIELSSITLKYNINKIIDWLNRDLMNYINFDVNFVQLYSNHQGNDIKLPFIDRVKAENIFQFCDIIYSCHIFISLNSGSHALACSLPKKNFKQLCLVSAQDYNWIMKDKKFIFPNVEYIKIDYDD